MSEVSVNDIMSQIPSHFNREMAKDINANIQFSLSGEQGGEWGMAIMDQKCEVWEGKIEKPNLTLKSDAVLATQILSGEVDGMGAYMMGKLKLFGDLSLAMKLVKLFNK